MTKFKINNDLNDRIIKKPIFGPIPQNLLSVKDIVIVYNDGHKNKIINKKITDVYPIIYDKFYDDNIKLNLTISVCPFSGSAIGYIGKYLLTNKIHKNGIVLKNKNNEDHLLFNISNLTYSIKHKKIIDKCIKKIEMKIMNLKDALILYPDSLFLNLDIPKNIKKVNTSNHSKKLIYGIIYKSLQQENKYTAIISTKEDGFNYLNNGYFKYFAHMDEKIKDKHGFVIPCHLSSWLNLFPDSKIIELTKKHSKSSSELLTLSSNTD